MSFLMPIGLMGTPPAAPTMPTVSLIDSVHTNTTAPHGSTNYTPNIPADTEDLYILITATVDGTPNLLTVASVTVGASSATQIVPMTQVPGANGIATSIWHLNAPPTGSQQITVTYTQAAVCLATMVAALRALNVGGHGNNGQVQGTSDDTVSVTLSCSQNSRVIGAGGLKGGDTGPYTPLTDVVELADGDTGGSGNEDHSFFVGHMPITSAGSFTIGADGIGAVPEDHGFAALELLGA